MRRLILAASLALLAAPLAAAPGSAEAASCSNRKFNGTLLGAGGGALLGGAVTHGATGPIVGALGGAFVGREIGKNGCRERSYSSSSSSRSYRAPAARTTYAPPPAPPPAQRVYYDQYGRPLAAAAPAAYTPNYAAAPGACRTETHRYYDDRGSLVQRQVQVCSR